MKTASVFILSKDGTYLEKEAIELIEQVLSKSFEIVNAPAMNHILMKAGYEKGQRVLNAHNKPDYLLGAMEEAEEANTAVIVVAWNENEEGFPKPCFFVDSVELSTLKKELEENPKVDAWVSALNAHKIVRGL